MTVGVEEHTPAYKLFHYQFHCRIPAIHTRTETELEVRGYISTGDPERDKALAMEPMDIMATIKQMADHHKNGVEITLPNPRDAVRIYDIIAEFMASWDRALDNSYNIQVADQAFFADLDSFAAEVYKIARRYIPEEAGSGSLFDILDRMGSRNPLSRPGGGERKTTFQTEHKSMSESISKKALQRDRIWRK